MIYIYIYIKYICIYIYIILYCHIGDERGTEHLKEMKMIISLRSGDSGVFQMDSVVLWSRSPVISSLLLPLSYGKSLGFLGQELQSIWHTIRGIFAMFMQCTALEVPNLEIPRLRSRRAR